MPLIGLSPVSVQFEKLSQELRAEGLGFGTSFAAAQSALEPDQKVEPESEPQVDKQDLEGENVIAALAALTMLQNERNKKTTDKALKQLSPEQYGTVKQVVKARQDAEHKLKPSNRNLPS